MALWLMLFLSLRKVEFSSQHSCWAMHTAYNGMARGSSGSADTSTHSHRHTHLHILKNEVSIKKDTNVPRDIKMAQQVQGLGANPDDTNSIPRIHMMEGEN